MTFQPILSACSYFNQLNPKYNATKCSKNGCFSMWQKNADKFRLLNKGCWTNAGGCESNYVKNILFCCCDGRFCNRAINPEYCFRQVQEQLSWLKIVKIVQNLKNLFFSIMPNVASHHLVIMVVLISFIVTALLGWYLLSLYEKKQVIIKEWLEQFSGTRNEADAKRLSQKDSDQIEKEPLKSENGSRADIYKGKLIRKANKMNVAIKVYREENKFHFDNEFRVYNLVKHENILEFLKAKKVSNEFWLITMYQQNGSLLNYLKKSTVDLNQLIRICLDISNGLAYLHGQNRFDATIAHLDIKPGNIFLDDRLNACLGDFELSKVFYNSKRLFADISIELNRNTSFHASIDASKQRGTTRYLAPEILSRTLNTSRTPSSSVHQYIESLLKSDIYSCSLVFWEILNRLNNQSNEYVMVFEKCKTDDELIDSIVHKRERPRIAKSGSNCLLNAFCQTIEECWTHDPKSRLSASRLSERLRSIHNLINKI